MARKSGGAPIIGPSKGARERIGEIDVDITARYLELAVPLSLELRTASNFWPRFYLGRAVALELSCDTSGDDGSARLEFDCDEIIDIPGEGSFLAFTETRSPDFGILFGAGLDIVAGPGAIVPDLRYNLGLTNINDFDIPGEEDFEIRNRAFQLMLGYGFFFGG